MAGPEDPINARFEPMKTQYLLLPRAKYFVLQTSSCKADAAYSRGRVRQELSVMRLEDIVAADLAASVSGELGTSSILSELTDATPDQIADLFLENFIEIQILPNISSSIDAHQVVKISSEGTGASTKLGHAIINWKKILHEGPNFVLTGASSFTDPLLFALAGVVLITQLSKHVHVELTRDHVNVLLLIVKNGEGSPPKMSKSDIAAGLDEAAEGHESRLSAIDRLAELGVLTIDGQVITLKDKVKLNS